MKSRRWYDPGTALLDFGACLVAAVAWTWPLAARLDRTLRDAYDAATQAWVLAWVRHALTTVPLSLFQANAFAPAHDVLAFSEPLVGYGVLSLPLSLLGLGPAGCMNALCILLLAGAAWAVARLARELGAPRGAALAGAFAATFGALTTVQLGFVSFTAFGGIPLVLLAWRRLDRERTFRAASLLGLSLAALAWFSLHFFAFVLVPLAFLIALALFRERRAIRPFAARALAGAAVTALLVLPLAIPLLRVRLVEGFTRGRTETADYSALPSHWLATTDENPGQRFLPFRSGSERALYPGTVAIALALLSLAALRTPGVRPLIGTGALLVAIGFFGSLGPSTPFFPSLATLVPPLYGGIRVAARFAFVSLVGFGLLAAGGVTVLARVAREARTRRVGFALLLVAIAADVRQAQPFDLRPEPVPPVERFLARAEVGGPILHLPLHHAAPDARILLASTAHFKPVVNGTSSYIPQRNVDLAEALWKAPIPPETFERIERWPVGTIVVHEHALPLANVSPTLRFLEGARAEGRLSPPLRFPHRGGTDWVFGVVAVRGNRAWSTAPVDGREDLEEFRRRASSFPAFDGTEDPSIPASIDSPSEGGTVRGDLLVRGWSQDERGECQVVEISLDGDRREPGHLIRNPRPDVAAALPRLGDCTLAGYEVVLPFLPGDEGRHDLRVVFRSSGGRMRTLSRPINWLPGGTSFPPPPS
jgi:hypothetical protein